MRVRDMTAADIDAVSTLRVRAWQSAYAEWMPRSYLSAMSIPKDAAERRRRFADGTSTNLVAEADGRLTGWAAFGPYRGINQDADPSDNGELYALHVRPDLIGTGVGRALMNSSLTKATARGFPHLLLWVIRDNTRARRFYERTGFTPDGTQDTHQVGATAVPVVRYSLPLERQPPAAGRRREGPGREGAPEHLGASPA